ncbi:DUF2178 domain-containing protein [Candidatus Woesebacteria bacterium]|nr:DUF2178 domain-containing protein [Candidatus Woesebacteria bacterium]
MNTKMYTQLQKVITFFVGLLVSISVVRNSYLLATAGIVTGLVFLFLVRAKANIKTDEREQTIQEKAARMTYAIFAPTIGIAALLLLLPSKGGIAVFSKGEWLYLESLGMIFAYLSLFLIALYAISYHFFNQRYGGGGNEK